MAVRKSAIISLFVSAAAIVVVGFFLHAFLAKSPASLGTFEVSEGTRFTVAHGKDVKIDDGELTEGSEVVLEQDVFEIQFESGSKAVIQAPPVSKLWTSTISGLPLESRSFP